MPSRMRLLLAVSATAGALALLPGAGSGATAMLIGDVGTNDAFVISLTDANGNMVTHLDPGTYTVLIHDRSAEHNFDLFGPGGVSAKTDVAEVGDVTWTLTFVDGKYTYQCDPHASRMTGSFTVGTPPPETRPAPVPARPSRIAASVAAGGRISLAGPAVVKAGRAVITVHDRSRTANFHLTGLGLNKKTGIAFRGTSKWSVTLRPGKYVFRSDAAPRTRGTLTVR
jgi:plastocyanin